MIQKLLKMLTQDWMNSKLQKSIHKHPNQYISFSAEKAKQKSSINETWRSIKRKSSFDQKNKSSDRYQRSSSQQDTFYKFSRQRIKNAGYISHLLSLLRKNHSKQKKSQEKSYQMQEKSELNFQQYHIHDQMAPSKIIDNNRLTKKKFTLSSLSKQKEKQKNVNNKISKQEKLQTEVTSKQLNDYSKFIQSKTPYYTQINYKELRKMQKIDALADVDIKQYKIIQNLTLCMIDIFNGDQQSTEYLLMEYCSLFFQNQQRRKFQVIVNVHIFKSFAPKIKSVYAYQRFWFYLIYKLVENNLIFILPVSPLLLAGCKLIDKLLKFLYEAVTESLSKNSTSVLQAFKSLKIVKQIQKIIQQFKQLIKKLQTFINKQSQGLWSKQKQFHQQYTHIMTAMKPFLIQSSFYQLQQYLCRTQIILSWKYLKIPPVPYLPEKNKDQKKYTLVMGINKVIILYNSSSRILKYRPYMDTFLQRLKDHFQIVIFSDLEKDITDKIVKQIEKQETFFQARLYRNHMSYKNGSVIKDISKLGRNLNQIILFDSYLPFLEQFSENQLVVPQFKPENSNSIEKQKTLLKSMHKLMKISKQYPSDIRKLLKKASDLYNIPQVASIQQNTISASHCGNVVKTNRQ